MEKQPLVSVIIPTYGIPIFLKKAIESVINQTLNDWELIIVDDNNPDTEARKKTEEILLLFSEDRRIKYIKHECNRNGAAARNTGLVAAKGRYCAFLDSDDEYMPERLQKCADALETAEGSIGGIYTGCKFVRGGKVYRIVEKIPSGNFLVETLACTFMFCTGSNIFMRMEVVRELNGFDERFIRHQDYEFLARFFENYDLKAIPETLVLKNNENLNVPNFQKNIDVKKMYINKFKRIIDSLPVKKQDYIYGSHCIALANIAASTGKWKEAMRYSKRANEYKQTSMKTKMKLLLLYIRSLGGKRG